ncbi:putative trafficking pga2 [Erysiphe necator]|uniref:Putative trafficking pga2 n=1 Tax=Uncinula necator TaxID=52586 RepID=A0A0B1P3S4_UNCNE|nr:putative trafficking pga2 [Erysiphe necator]
MSNTIPSFVRQGGDNFVRNVTGMWDGMRPRDYIRIVVIVGAYLLIRPYLLKLAAKVQAKEFAKHNPSICIPSEKGKLSPNDLRDGSQMKVKNDDAENESLGIVSGSGWGEKARRRQSKNETTNSKLNERQKSDLKDEKKNVNILEYLVDYEEGKEGW